jgi:hypothetical protein
MEYKRVACREREMRSVASWAGHAAAVCGNEAAVAPPPCVMRRRCRLRARAAAARLHVLVRPGAGSGSLVRRESVRLSGAPNAMTRKRRGVQATRSCARWLQP